MEIATEKECEKGMERIIGFYSNERPHMSIGYQTPDSVHQQQSEQKKCWRNPGDR
jgi:transposase InsO family protein